MADVNLGYLGFYLPNQSTYAGGLMICDSKGFPIEFKYSEPVVPTKVQQVLYGKVLDKYIKIDVIAESIIKSVTSSINVLIVQDEFLLEQKYSSNFVVLRISPTKSPALSNIGDNIKIKDREFLLQASANANPIRIQFASSYNIDENSIKATMETLTKVGGTMDIDEPLSRVYRALELICQQAQIQKQESNQ